ncbi:hypothetical protein ACFVMC_09730 [Nocardia sp. NPDC127579]|uniref:PPE domain-containing protein n=1 Tax=Nocardia sp. NPDC127579 TaxID=3345402 RepID=UPI003631D80C
MREIKVTAERWPHTRTDPDYAPSVEIFDSITHKEIHDRVQLMDPTVLNTGQVAWQQTATGLADAVTAAHTEIRASIADGWRGSAAQTAADAVLAFEQQGSQLADVMSTVAQRLGQAGDAAEALRSAIGIPSDEQPDLAAALLDPNQATGNTATQKATENDRQDVVAAMESIYTNAFIQSGAGVPAFPDAATADIPVAAANPSAPGVSLQLPVSSPESPAAQPVSTVPAAAQPESAAPAPTPESEPAATTPASALPVASLPNAAVPGETVPAAATAPAGATVSAAPVAAPVPDRPVPASAGAPVSPAAATTPASFVTTSPATDDERKREERRRESNSEAVSGAGAGAVGGLMGGAFAAGAGDSPRGGSGLSRPAPAALEDDEDDELHWSDDELTFLEPADEPRELIGSMDPTTPPVVGEWTELE